MERPSRCRLFPYTTLFRSRMAAVHVAPPALAVPTEGDEIVADYATLGLTLDRKSTRLNSSHQIISYAVFCLKKKKTSGITIVTSTASDPIDRGSRWRVCSE